MNLKIFYVFLIIFLSSFYFEHHNSMDKGVMLFLLVVVIFSLLFFANRKENEISLKGQFLKHSSLAILGILIVHFQYYIDFLLGNITTSELYIWVNIDIVVKSMILSLIGLLSFMLGYLVYKKRKVVLIKANLGNVCHTKYLIFLSAFALVIYFYTVNPLYLLGYYGAEDIGVTATYAILIFEILLFGSIIQESRNMVLKAYKPNTFFDYLKSLGTPILLLTSLYLLSVLLSGDRGALITYSLCYFSGYYFVSKIKFSMKKGLLFGFIGASVITLLGVARSQEKSLGFVEKVQIAFREDPFREDLSFLPQTKELAGSVKTLHHALDYVPEKHDYLYGRFQFQQIIVAIPFFSMFTPIIFEDTSTKYSGSASFITWMVQGDYPTSGNGTSVIADYYIDLGLIGVIIGMFFFGYFMRFAEVKMYVDSLPSLFTHVFFVVYLSSAIYIARSSFLFGFRTVVWIFIVLIINKYIFNKKNA